MQRRKATPKSRTESKKGYLKRIVLLGPPGSGKGSLATLVEERLRVPHVSAGEIFRQEIKLNTSLGKRVKRFVSTGKLIPDWLVVKVMTTRLAGNKFAKGFIVDGFPRTRGQAAGLNKALKLSRKELDAAIYLAAKETLLIRRLTGRRVCESCGVNYHIRSMKPRRAGYCDKCSGKLITRKDDEPKTIKARLNVDKKSSRPLINYYERKKLLHSVNAAGNLETVFNRVEKFLKAARSKRDAR